MYSHKRRGQGVILSGLVLVCIGASPIVAQAEEGSLTTEAALGAAPQVLRGGAMDAMEGAGKMPIALRLGAMVSPRTKFVGGVDITLPGVQVIPGWTTRVDAEAIVSANFGGASTLIPLTFNQVHSKGLIRGNRFYGGLGGGLYIGNVTRFGGKFFIGADTSTRLRLEAGVHFSGYGPTLLTVQARLPL